MVAWRCGSVEVWRMKMGKEVGYRRQDGEGSGRVSGKWWMWWSEGSCWGFGVVCRLGWLMVLVYYNCSTNYIACSNAIYSLHRLTENPIPRGSRHCEYMIIPYYHIYTVIRFHHWKNMGAILWISVPDSYKITPVVPTPNTHLIQIITTQPIKKSQQTPIISTHHQSSQLLFNILST